ncbi:MAG: cysteine desulfurase family protein [Ruthenibacterium sp.]
MEFHYLDNAATTRVDDTVADVANDVLRAHFANPSSLYTPGAKSEAVITAARKSVADSLGCAPQNITFTSCGSEGNNLAIFGAVNARKKWADTIVVTGYEHPSVQNCMRYLAETGWNVITVFPDAAGHVDADALVNAVTSTTALVAVMHVNNEVGSILDVAAIAARVKAQNSRTAVHTDGVQAFGKLPIALAATAIDSYTVSGHKIHAPKGVGALYLRKGYFIAQTFFGGGQERGFRPGTENIAYIAAFGAAAAKITAAQTQNIPHLQALNEHLTAALAQMPDVTRNSPPDALSSLVNFSVSGVKSETMLHFLESRGVYVSSGSACSKGEASHTLTAMHLPKKRVDTALRVSFCAENTLADVDALLAALREGIAILSKIR